LSLPTVSKHIQAKVCEMVPQVDIETLTIKSFVQLLSNEFGMDLKAKKGVIRQALTDTLAEADNSDGDNEGNEEEEEDNDDNKPKKSHGGGGLAAKKEISTKLADFLGQGTSMARTEIVKRLWEYIREHSLQNPSNGREIILDAKLKQVFGCDRFTMFTMNKYIGAHIHPFKPVDLTTNSSGSTSSPASTSTRESRKRRAASKAPSSTPKKPRKVGTQPPYLLTDELAAIVGKPIMPRPQVVSEIWVYIKAHNLQNPADKREIICDDALRMVMKKDKVTMFNMNQLITPHLLEKLDKDSYQHEVKEEAQDSD
jgi:upstream activation factor subunit UAF30